MFYDNTHEENQLWRLFFYAHHERNQKSYFTFFIHNIQIIAFRLMHDISISFPPRRVYKATTMIENFFTTHIILTYSSVGWALWLRWEFQHLYVPRVAVTAILYDCLCRYYRNDNKMENSLARYYRWWCINISVVVLFVYGWIEY